MVMQRSLDPHRSRPVPTGTFRPFVAPATSTEHTSEGTHMALELKLRLETWIPLDDVMVKKPGEMIEYGDIMLDYIIVMVKY